MNDPKRMIHGQPDALETALLRAVRGEAPPPGARHRMLATLGVSATGAAVSTAATKAAAAIAGASAKTASAAGTSILIAKGTVLGLVGAVCIGAAVRALPSFGITETAPTTTASAHSSHPLTRATPASTGTSLEFEDKQTEQLPPQNKLGLTPAEARLSPSGTVHAPQIASAPKPSALAEEVAVLDQARSAAAQKDPIRTLQLISSYQHRFPSGAMAPEAQLLQVEALVQTGQSAAAAPIARGLLQAAPNGPHAERIRALLPTEDLNTPASNLRSSRAAFDTLQ